MTERDAIDSPDVTRQVVGREVLDAAVLAILSEHPDGTTIHEVRKLIPPHLPCNWNHAYSALGRLLKDGRATREIVPHGGSRRGIYRAASH